MNLFIHILRQTKKFIKFPIQFLKILLSDIKKDFFYNHKKKYNKVLIVGVQKSGTTLIEWILSEMGYVNQVISPLRIFYDNDLNYVHDLSDKMLSYVPSKKFSFLKRHAEATAANLKMIEETDFKIILSIRDLKQIMISRYLHIISDKNFPQYYKFKDLGHTEGFRLSLIENHVHGEIPIKIFKNWLNSWEMVIKEKKISCLILNYNDFKNNEKNYIEKIIKYLEVEDCDSNIIFNKHIKKVENMKNKRLEDNLKKNLHPQTYNAFSDDIKSKLNKEISDNEFENLIKKYD
ncbi:sulfotransferase domain-containing protein [Pelagibacteraceae bacterium]|nr:sulfotransferase domain-containing protein [Pelagibacteraceae bacterium]